MRRVVIALFVAACVATSPPPPAPTTPATPPSPLAQLEASRDLTGAMIGRAGQPTVVVVLASWCRACREELRVFDALRSEHPRVRWLALNYQGHEEYADRGDDESIRALGDATPWLRIVSAGDALFDAFGAPSKIPTVIVYDSQGAQAARYDRHARRPPSRDELDALLRTLR